MDRQNLLPVSGVSSFYRKPSRGRISSSENVSLVPAHQEDAENNRFQAEPSDLTDDHRAYIAVIRETGGTTYGDVAGLSGMGGTRASLTEEELLRRGLIIRAPFGKTVAR